MLHRFVLVALLLVPTALVAQRPGPLAAAAPAFPSWEPVHRPAPPSYQLVRGAGLGRKDRAGNAALGGVLGALAGVAVCTVVSNLVKDEGTGFSTCTAKGYLLLGGVGLGLGALIGLAS